MNKFINIINDAEYFLKNYFHIMTMTLACLVGVVMIAFFFSIATDPDIKDCSVQNNKLLEINKILDS